MKKMKRASAFFLASVMLLAMTCTAFAAETEKTGTVATSIDSDKQASMANHTFTAYQIFKGTQGTDDHTITNLDWGDGINSAAFLTALKADPTVGGQFANITYIAAADNVTGVNRCADAVARVVSGWKEDSDYARAFAKVADAHKAGTGTPAGGSLEAGYYLVVDTTDFTSPDFTGDKVKNLAVLRMTKEDTFNPESKTGVPTLTKEVKEVNDSDITVTDQWGDVADYDIGDDVPFRLTGTMPADLASYTTYKYVFHDTLSESLDFNKDVVVTVKSSVADMGTKLDPGQYAVTEDGNSFAVTIDDVKKLPDVTVSADTVITVDYTAKLTANGITYGTGITNTAHLEFSNNQNSGGSGDTGTTPDDTVVVFTFKMVVNKVDSDEQPLEGAEFTLYKLEEKAGADGLVEGKSWKPAATTEAGSNKSNVFTFEGLDAGEYKLSETKTPAGYNRAEDMYFTVTATYTKDEVPSISALTVSDVKDKNGNVIKKVDNSNENAFTITAATNTGTLTTSIVNLKGILLPSTGGIGTTIFYVVGAIMVLGAGVLLVTKKRMSRTR